MVAGGHSDMFDRSSTGLVRIKLEKTPREFLSLIRIDVSAQNLFDIRAWPKDVVIIVFDGSASS